VIWREYFSWRESFTKGMVRQAQLQKRLLSYMIATKGDRSGNAAVTTLRLSEWNMKLSRANGWRGIVALVALLTGAAPTHAQTPQDGSASRRSLR